jgi:capsular exopolysaccharide synthesis family protein
MSKLQINFPDLPYEVEEALNRLRVNIKFCGKHTKKILVTSSIPNEGKSSVAVYLWRMLAEAGFKSVFVDADLRKSVLPKRHEMKCDHEDRDLSSYLSGINEYEEIVYETNIPNGYCVPCFNLIGNPSALLEDQRFRELLDQLSDEFRFVIIDSPPLHSVSDGLQIASMCDGALLVVRGGETPKGVIKQSLHQLDQVECKLLGVVLNRVETSTRSYKKYYGQHGKYNEYSEYYAYGENKNGAII